MPAPTPEKRYRVGGQFIAPDNSPGKGAMNRAPTLPGATVFDPKEQWPYTPRNSANLLADESRNPHPNQAIFLTFAPP